MKINKIAMIQAMNQTKRQNSLEDEISKEWYGCLFEELDYDEKELVQYEAIDRMQNV